MDRCLGDLLQTYVLGGISTTEFANAFTQHFHLMLKIHAAISNHFNAGGSEEAIRTEAGLAIPATLPFVEPSVSAYQLVDGQLVDCLVRN